MPRYRLIFEHDDNGTVLVTSPDFPLATYGETPAQAAGNAEDAAITLLQSIIDNNETVPTGSRDGSEPYLPLSLSVELKITLYSTSRSSGCSRVELQQKLGWSRQAVDRLFQLRRETSLEELTRALAALDKAVEISLIDRHSAVAA